MKKNIISAIFITLFLSGYSAKSQNDSIAKAIKIKINPLQAIFLNEYAINTEYTFAKHYGIDFRAGYFHTNYLGFLHEDFPDKGLIFQIGLKKYHNTFSRKKRNVNQYTGLWLLNRDIYEYYYQDKRYIHYANSCTLKALIGSETFYNNFIFDLYFGFGFRLYSIKHYDDSNENGQEFVPTLHFGMNIGFNFPLKKIIH